MNTMLTRLVASVIGFLVGVSESIFLDDTCSFDSVAQFRSEKIATSFDVALMEGVWYEHAYMDPAMIGASCPTLNCIIDGNGFSANLSVMYKSLPFTIVEHHASHDSAKRGVFRKNIDIPFGFPGGSLVGLPTAIVDTTVSTDGLRYDSALIYSCYNALVTEITELVFMTRNRTIDPQFLQGMIGRAKKEGLKVSESGLLGLSRVDWSKCPMGEHN
eukprot:TRINITY_DN2905_c0_g1_i1.p1 TRINITY_DN2905_c0_g1~~TRINITY_DN2905_c0_g1_i1.p1  ORF type:complete len:216 (+),score=27.12 TRINITY_DN2905_c0_g1_i1:78-725(+)